MNDFIEACKKGANKDRLGILKIGEKEITGSDSLKSFTVEEGCYVDGSIIGAIYIKCLTGEFVNLNESLLEKKIEAKVEIKGNETVCHLGNYIVEKPKDEKTSSSSSIKAYDYLIDKIDEKYVCGINYEEQDETNKICVSDLYQDICRNLGLTPKTIEFLNSDIEILNNPFTNNETNRTVLKAIATVACSFVEIDENNQIDLSWLSDTLDYTFLKSDYSTLESNDTVLGPINTVVLKNSEVDDENVTKRAENVEIERSIVISEDYILYDAELRKKAIDKIFERLNGLTYVDMKLTTYYGKPFLKMGSKIKIETDNGFLETYVLKHQFTFNGAFTSTIESPLETEQEIKTKQNVTLKEALKNTQIIVDKQNQKIEAIVKEVDISNETMKEMKNEITQNKEETTNLISQTGGSNLLVNSQFYQEADGWTTSENTNLEVLTSGHDIEHNTVNKTELILKNGILSQYISLIVGKEYTISFKYKKNGINTRKSSIKMYWTESEFETVLELTSAITNRTNKAYSFIAPTSSAKIVIETEQDEFYMSDFIIQSGTSTEWSPNALETRGLGHKLTKSDLELYDLGKSNEKAKLDYNNLTFYQGNNLKAEYGADNMQVEKGLVKTSFEMCGLVIRKIDDDNVIVN